MRWILIILILTSCNQDEDMLFQSMLSGGETVTPPVFPTNGVRVFIYTGQSNCPGRGLNTDATAGELASQSQFKIWSKINSQFENLDIGTNNLNSTADSHGIELGMAANFNTYYPSETGYFIKWGVSSTPIIQHLTGGTVYTELWINYVKPAINNLINAGKIPYVYFIYTQGERDANTSLTPPSGGDYLNYAPRFETLKDLWRTNIGASLPFVNYQLIDPGPSGYEMTAINDDFAASELLESLHKVLQTNGLGDIGDDLHYDYVAHKAASILAYNYFANNLGQPVTNLL